LGGKKKRKGEEGGKEGGNGLPFRKSFNFKKWVRLLAVEAERKEGGGGCFNFYPTPKKENFSKKEEKKGRA